MSVRFNGIDLKTEFNFELEDVELGPPRVRKNVVTIPGVHGVIDFGGTYEERDIFIRGHLADAFDHATVLDNLRKLNALLAMTPLAVDRAPIMGQPLSQTSVLGTLLLSDFTNEVFQVIYNGTFETDFLGPRLLSKNIRLRIGFRQVQPWVSSSVKFNYVGNTTTDSGYFAALNDLGLHVPPKVMLTSASTVTSFSLYNYGVDCLNTKSITGTVLGTPIFNTIVDNSLIINGAFNFTAGTAGITFPISNAFSQEHGSVEFLYIPSAGAGAPTRVFWTLYVDATHFWRCLYDSADDRFKFHMKNGGTETTVNSGLGIIGTSAVHRITCYWSLGVAYISRNNSTRVSGTQTKIAYPTSIRVGSFGDDTLPANGIMDEFIVWNKDVGQGYNDEAYGKRLSIPFGRPVPGVLMYASFDSNYNAVGAGDKLFTYTATLDNLDRLFVDMEKRTVTFWDDGILTFSNAIANMSNHFFDLIPGVNSMHLVKSGAGDIRADVAFTKRYLI